MYDPNIPPDAQNSDYWEERKKENYDVFGNAMPTERDEDEFEVEDDSIIDRNFLSNRDCSDEHFPHEEL
jgi:hypothetical protein